MPSAKFFVISATAAAFVLTAATAATAAGNPGPGAGEDTAKTEKVEKKTKKKRRGGCPFRRAISGFSVIDDKHFVLETGATDYLVTLTPGCHGLDFEMNIAIKSIPAAGICVERGDRVILNNQFTCLIRDIEWVENRKEAKKLVEERKKAEEEEKAKKDDKSD